MEAGSITLDDITIRNRFRPGDIGCITWLHGTIYNREYNHGTAFEAYVAGGLAELFHQYDPQRDRAWICEHDGTIAGTVFLQHREGAAQLRYFLIRPQYRGIGLGKRLMALYMDFLRECGYTSSFLWTTSELHAAGSLYRRHGFELAEEMPSTRFGRKLMEQKYEWKSPSRSNP